MYDNHFLSTRAIKNFNELHLIALTIIFWPAIFEGQPGC